MNYSKICDLEIKGKRIVIKDSMIMLSENEETPEWPFVTVENGSYEVQAIENADPYSATRIIKSGTNGVRGKKIGDVEVDHAGVGIIDYDSFLTAVKKNYDDYSTWTSMELDDFIWGQVSGEIKFSNEPLVFLHSGDGDGTYPVYELLENNNVVGLECDFLVEVE